MIKALKIKLVSNIEEMKTHSYKKYLNVLILIAQICISFIIKANDNL